MLKSKTFQTKNWVPIRFHSIIMCSSFFFIVNRKFHTFESATAVMSITLRLHSVLGLFFSCRLYKIHFSITQTYSKNKREWKLATQLQNDENRMKQTCRSVTLNWNIFKFFYRSFLLNYYNFQRQRIPISKSTFFRILYSEILLCFHFISFRMKFVRMIPLTLSKCSAVIEIYISIWEVYHFGVYFEKTDSQRPSDGFKYYNIKMSVLLLINRLACSK